MHLGNVFSALLSWLSVKSKGGKWLLRIEDIDPGRSRQAYADLLMDDLEWLGLTWDGEPVYQSQRSDIYEHYFQVLKDQGMTYPCYCTRAHHVGDFIIRRKDGAWAYQLAVVIDDALMGVTEVVRGCDLLLSSPQQMYVAQLLGFNPPQFIHLPLLCNAQGQRLSKRDGGLDMASLRQNHTAPEIIGLLAYYAGLQPTSDPITPQELLSFFSWEQVPQSNVLL